MIAAGAADFSRHANRVSLRASRMPLLACRGSRDPVARSREGEGMRAESVQGYVTRLGYLALVIVSACGDNRTGGGSGTGDAPAPTLSVVAARTAIDVHPTLPTKISVA